MSWEYKKRGRGYKCTKIWSENVKRIYYLEDLSVKSKVKLWVLD